ncbi:unnamed protein product [Prorocentrum cordatum]|uniref:Uncharacterized protein n=1 Tax=Prorocentrum cordatum TaxID=2364126 RepID=A0ABN9VFG3_9DINO|nr:unnamed protein product [Polarella glacialis]
MLRNSKRIDLGTAFRIHRDVRFFAVFGQRGPLPGLGAVNMTTPGCEAALGKSGSRTPGVDVVTHLGVGDFAVLEDDQSCSATEHRSHIGRSRKAATRERDPAPG